MGYNFLEPMEKPLPGMPSPSTIRKPPAFVTVASLMAQVGAGTAPALVDVRDPKLFHPRHLPGSQNAPDSQTTALIRKLQTLDKAVLVCDDGKLSSLVCRTLGFCKITSVCYLEGGINAWAAAGGKLSETTRSGFEHEIKPMPQDPDEKPKEPAPTRWLKSIKGFFGGDEDDGSAK
jgi:rhodanese-related sulfurtransferase